MSDLDRPPPFTDGFLSDSFVRAAEADARERAARLAADPDRGWTIRLHEPPRVRASRNPNYRATYPGLWTAVAIDPRGHRETECATTALEAERKLRVRLELAAPSASPIPCATVDRAK
jgi:hypothetical protein